MRKVLIAVIFLWGCGGNPPPQEEEYRHDLPSKDSILNLADEVIEYVINKERGSRTKIDSLATKISQNSNLSREQLIQMAQEISKQKAERDSVSERLSGYETKRIIRKDCIIIDTIKKTYIHIDTIYDTVVVEIQVNRKKKRRKK